MSTARHNLPSAQDRYALWEKDANAEDREARRQAGIRAEEERRKITETQIEEIVSHGWTAISDTSLVKIGNDSRASLKEHDRRHYPSDWEIFQTVLVQWLDEKILPAAVANLSILRNHHAHLQRRHWQSISIEELLEYFLIHFLTGETNSLDQNVDKNRIASARDQLSLGQVKTKVINSALALGEETFGDIVKSIPFYISKLIKPGGAVTIDEAIWASYAPSAERRGLLRYIPEKPHQRGLLSYLLCQRLVYSGRPIAIAFAPTFVSKAPTPKDALMQMIAALSAGNLSLPLNWTLIADSLWSYPSYILEIMESKWKFAITVKSISTGVSTALRDLSATDLPVGRARTYSDKYTILQTYHSERGISCILTNAFEQRAVPRPPVPPSTSYETALSHFLNDPAAGLIDKNELPDEARAWPKAVLVHHITGWDVLRPMTSQGDTGPLTAAMLTSLHPECIRAIFRSKFPALAAKKVGKKKMIAELCPGDEETSTAPTSKRGKRRLDTAHLEAKVKEVQGEATSTHRVYDLFSAHHASIDQMDKDFYAHSRTRYVHGCTHSGLLHISSYLLANVYAISEELARARLHAASNGNNRAVYEYQHRSFDLFLCDLVDTFCSERQPKHH